MSPHLTAENTVWLAGIKKQRTKFTARNWSCPAQLWKAPVAPPQPPNKTRDLFIDLFQTQGAGCGDADKVLPKKEKSLDLF